MDGAGGITKKEAEVARAHIVGKYVGPALAKERREERSVST